MTWQMKDIDTIQPKMLKGKGENTFRLFLEKFLDRREYSFCIS